MAMKPRRERDAAGAKRAGEASSKEARTGHRARGAKSELHERLKAARLYADKTQQDVAGALVPPISRSALSYWENDDPTKRTVPAPQQVVQLARICGVPVEWIMDDAQTVDGLYAYMQTKEMELSVPHLDPRQEAATRAFWSAVEHTVLQENVRLAGRFNVPVRSKEGAMEFLAGFLNGKTLGAFANVAEDWRHDVAREGAMLLAMEHLLGRKYTKLLIVYAPTTPLDAKAVASYGSALDVDVRAVTTINEAARLLLRVT